MHDFGIVDQFPIVTYLPAQGEPGVMIPHPRKLFAGC